MLPKGENQPALDSVDSESDRFWLQLASTAHTTSSNYFDTAIRNRIIQDVRQFQSIHPEGSKYFTDSFTLKSKLFRPKTRATIRKNEATASAAFFSTEDVISIRPENDDDEVNRMGAQFIKGLMQYRLTRPKPHGLPWFITCIGAYQEAETCGVVASHQDWLKDKDRPEIRLLPIENVKFDPAADWRDPVDSSPYLIIEWPMYVIDVKAKMRSGEWREYNEQAIIAASKNTTDTIRMTRENRGIDPKEQGGGGQTDYMIVWVHENMIRVDDMDVRFFTLGKERMLSKPELVTDRYPWGRPVVIGFTILEAHKAYKSSKPSLTRDVQIEMNDVANERRHAVRLANEKRYIIKRGRNVDMTSLVRNVPGSITLADDVNDVRVITTDDATASAYQEQDRLNLDFDDLAGTFSGSSVASNRKLNETVGGMNLLSANANQVSEYDLKVFTETWVEPVLRQVIVMEQSLETNPKVLQMAAAKAGVTPEQMSDELFTALIRQDVLLTCNVGVGAVNPMFQLEKFLKAMTSLTAILGPDALHRPLSDQEMEVAKEIFGKCGYKDGARFLMKREQNEDPEKMKLLQQVEELQKALQAKNPPEVVAAQVAKLTSEKDLNDVRAMVQRVEALYASMNTAQTAVQVPGVAPVADAIAKSAGFVDQDAGPIYPAGVQQQQIPPDAQIPQNTSPMFPANAASGAMDGIEAGAAPAVQYDNGQVPA
ncbi:hypothetical protein UFOVP1419_53 [uncultured Caudovirales phage]|uniref:Uncharacterized protein n=1 Tax=uncultured Caudovirales phage TaxID=2100421 RepID=A0A6J5SET9_9CAUD|nr:hypothetical protein UFOVP1419_53 [uncultured Caudovirales phage]